MVKRKTAKRMQGENAPESLDIPDDEQKRLIEESGILRRIPLANQVEEVEETKEDLPLAEEIFNDVLLLVPFSFLLMMMEILVHFQYGRRPSLQAVVSRMITGVPILAVLLFYTARYKTTRQMQFALMVASILAGTRMVWLINRASWLVNMQQCPPLATLWIYTVVQLDLGPAVMGLTVVGMWSWYKGMKFKV